MAWIYGDEVHKFLFCTSSYSLSSMLRLLNSRRSVVFVSLSTLHDWDASLQPELWDQCRVSRPQGLEEFVGSTLCNHHQEVLKDWVKSSAGKKRSVSYSQCLPYVWNRLLKLCDAIPPFLFYIPPNVISHKKPYLSIYGSFPERSRTLVLIVRAFVALKAAKKSVRGKIICVPPLHCITVFFPSCEWISWLRVELEIGLTVGVR